jgi:mRNA-degrading endonuclease RelE of RelBE toxin-antitoxin system
MTYSVKILPAAEKDLSGIPKRDRERLGKRINSLSDDPRPVIADRIAIVLVAGDRKDIYKRAKRRLT